MSDGKTSDRKMIALDVKGMTCMGCVNAVTRLVKRKDAEAEVKIDLASGRLDASTSVPAQELAAVISAGGYEAKVAA